MSKRERVARAIWNIKRSVDIKDREREEKLGWDKDELTEVPSEYDDLSVKKKMEAEELADLACELWDALES